MVLHFFNWIDLATVIKVEELIHMKDFAKAKKGVGVFHNSHTLILILPELQIPLATRAFNTC